MEVLTFSKYFISGLSLIIAHLVYSPNGGPHHSTVGLIFAITGLILKQITHAFNLPLQNLCNFKLQIETQWIRLAAKLSVK